MKVLNFSGELQGYIRKSGDAQGRHIHLTRSPGDALSVSFTPPADGLFDIQINVGFIMFPWSSRLWEVEDDFLPTNQDASKSTQATDALSITWMRLTGGAWTKGPN